MTCKAILEMGYVVSLKIAEYKDSTSPKELIDYFVSVDPTITLQQLVSYFYVKNETHFNGKVDHIAIYFADPALDILTCNTMDDINTNNKNYEK